MRYRDLIDDEQFLKEKPILQKEIASLRDAMRQTETRADKWLELTEKTFNFATYARKAFMVGDSQTKREILAALCLNPLMNNKNLLIDAEKWFVKIRKDYLPLKEQYERFELAKKPLNKEQTAVLEAVRSQWWRWRELNPRPDHNGASKRIRAYPDCS